jgi:hypothetical protein
MTGAGETAMQGTPYLTQGDQASEKRFNLVNVRAEDVRERALRAHERIAGEASELLGPYTRALRSDLVSESNRIEGYEYSASQIRELIATHKELLNAPVGRFMQSLRGDRKVYLALGLYRAQAMADEWAETEARPREYEIRALHELIAAGEDYAGRYKTKSNEIGGSRHRTVEPWDVPRAMAELSDWWTGADCDPALRATIVHAWLTHIHPFDDGNGRMARLLANLALTQAGYPPLLIRADTDRGQYYDALEASDDGDILPLYDLFVNILRRTVRTMSSSTYVEDVAKDRLLTSVAAQRSMWLTLPEQFMRSLVGHLAEYGWDIELQGVPDATSFALLADRDPDGNGWYLKIFDEQHRPAWLMWYGYNSNELLECTSGPTGYPSIFFSVRDDRPDAVHPYRPTFGEQADLPNEVVLRPLKNKAALLRWGYATEEMTIESAAQSICDALVRDARGYSD